MTNHELEDRLLQLQTKLYELDSKKRREDAMTQANRNALKPQDTYAYAYGEARQMLASLQQDITCGRAVAFERITLASLQTDPIELCERNAEIVEPASGYRVIELTALEGESL